MIRAPMREHLADRAPAVGLAVADADVGDVFGQRPHHRKWQLMQVAVPAGHRQHRTGGMDGRPGHGAVGDGAGEVHAEPAHLPHTCDAGAQRAAGVHRRARTGRRGRLERPTRGIHGRRSGEVGMAVPHARHDSPRLCHLGVTHRRRVRGGTCIGDPLSVQDDDAAVDLVTAA